MGNSSAIKREKLRGLIPNIFAVCRFMPQQTYFSYGYDALLINQLQQMPEEEMVTTPVEEGEDVDYKALYEKSQADVEKWKSRFKSAKAQEKERSQFEIDDSYIDKKVEEKLFFQNNPTAREVEKEIKEIQSKYDGMNVNDAFDLYLAKNKPELLSQKPSNTGVDGITKDPEPEKTWKEMSDKEFDERWKARGKK